MKRYGILLILLVLMVFTVSVFSVSAQEVDVGSMDNAQLTELLLQIMQRLEQPEEEAATPEPTPTPTPVPTSAPLSELSDDRAEIEALLTAIMQKLNQSENTGTPPEKPSETIVPVSDPEEDTENSIWEDKKLIVEALPEYMFIQPTKAPKPEKRGPGGDTDDNSHGFIMDDDVEYCPPPYYIVCYPDRCVCASPNG